MALRAWSPFQIFRSISTRTPTVWADVNDTNDVSRRRDLSDATLGSILALGVCRRHAPGKRDPRSGQLSISLEEVGGMATAVCNMASAYLSLRDLNRGLYSADCVGKMCGTGNFDLTILAQVDGHACRRAHGDVRVDYE